MELFTKLDWLPNVEDIIDDKFVNEGRLQNEGTMYHILNGNFHDPFYYIKPPVIKSAQIATKLIKQNIISNENQDRTKKKVRTKKKKTKVNEIIQST